MGDTSTQIPQIVCNNVYGLVAGGTNLNLEALSLRTVELAEVGNGVLVITTDKELPLHLREFLQIRGSSFGCKVLFMLEGKIIDALGFEVDPCSIQDASASLYYSNNNDRIALVQKAREVGVNLQEMHGLEPSVAEYLNNKWNFYNFCLENLGEHSVPYSELLSGYSIAQGDLVPILKDLQRMMYFLETQEINSKKVNLKGYKTGLMVRNIRANGGTGNFKFEIVNKNGDVVLQTEQGIYYLKDFINKPNHYYGLILRLLGDGEYIVSRLLEGQKDSKGSIVSPAQSAILDNGSVYTYPINGQVLNPITSACVGTHSIPMFTGLKPSDAESITEFSHLYFECVYTLHTNHPSMARVNIDYLMLSSREQEIMRLLLQSGDSDLHKFGLGVLGGNFVAVESNARATQFSASATNGLALGFGPTVINVLEAMQKGEFYLYSDDHTHLPIPAGITLEHLLEEIDVINQQIEEVFGVGSGLVLRTINPSKQTFDSKDEFGILVGATKPQDVEKILRFVFNKLHTLATYEQKYY